MVEKEETIEEEIDESSKLRQGNISIVLDSYDDLFSDFDPRPYSVKSLSDDFLIECKRAEKEKQGDIELRLLIPAHRRKIKDEIIIKRRLKDYFRKHFRDEEREKQRIIRNGFLWFFVGSIILFISTFAFESSSVNPIWKFLINFFVILTQPAGWFTMWEGLNRIFIVPGQNLPNYNFYKRMETAEIYFLNY